MKKNKTITRLISKLLFFCLCINTLPVSFPAQAKEELTQREFTALRAEIDRDVEQVRKTTKDLKIAKNAVSVAILGVGTIAAIVIAILAGIFVVSLRGKVRKLFDKLIPWLEKNVVAQGRKVEKVELARVNIESLMIAFTKPLGAWKLETARVPQQIEDLYKGLKIIKKSLPEGVMKNLTTIRKTFINSAKEHSTLKEKVSIEELGKALMPLLEKVKKLGEEKLLKNPQQQLKKWESRKLFATKSQKKSPFVMKWIIAPVAFVFAGLFGLLGTASTAILARIPFSKNSIKKVTELVRRLEDLENKFPGILTSEQRVVLAQFKKIAGDLTVQAILENLELKTKLTSLVNGLLQNKVLTKALGGKENAQKVLETYFTRRLRKVLFKRNLDKADAKLKALSIKFVYNRTKNKVAAMEKEYPMLQRATRGAVQEYIQEANKIFVKFNEMVADAIVKGKITPEPTIVRPRRMIVPL